MHIDIYKNTYQFLSYDNAIKRYIVKGTYEYDKCTSKFRQGFDILLANRSLKSIDYTNQYEATPLGIKIKFFALTFTYTLTEEIPNLPKITKQFEGKAKAYIDPDDGKWKLDSLSLSDKETGEVKSLFHFLQD